MKRCVSFIGIIILGLNLAFSKDYSNESLGVLLPNLENMDRTTNLWLANKVVERIESNLSKYTSFDIYDIRNDTKVKALQKQSQTDLAYDKNTAIQAGKLVSTKYVIFSTLTKDGSKYSFDCKFTNVTTGEMIPIMISGKKSTDDLYSNPGCAVDEMIIQLCDELGISLSALDKHELMKGKSDNSNEDSVKNELEMYRNQLDEIESQLKEIDFNLSEKSIVTKQTQLEMKKKKVESEIKKRQDDIVRLEKEKKKKDEQIKKDAERSESDQKWIEDREKKYTKIKQKIPKVKGEPLLTQIGIIEANKKVLVEIRTDTDGRVDSELAEIKKECQDAVNDKEREPYDIMELDENGKPTIAAINLRNSDIEEIKNEYEQKSISRENDIRKLFEEKEKSLQKEIYSDYAEIAKIRTINSMDDKDNIKYNVGDYNGEKKAWPVDLYVYLSDKQIFQQNIYVKSEKFCGVSTPNINDKTKITEKLKKEYEKFLDEVDLYDSLIKRGNPVFTFEIDYNANPKSPEFFSEYEINFLKIRIINTESRKVVESLQPSPKSVLYKMPIGYDIRTREEAQKYEQKVQKNEEKQLNKMNKEKTKQLEQEKKERIKKYKKEQSQRNRESFLLGVSDWPKGMSGFRGGVTFDNTKFVGADADVFIQPWAGSIYKYITTNAPKLPMPDNEFPYIFTGLTTGFLIPPSSIADEIDEKTAVKYGLDFGFNVCFSYPLKIYLKGLLGGVSVKTKTVEESTDDENIDDSEKKSSQTYFLFGGALGIQIPVAKYFEFFGEVGFNYINNLGTYPNFNAGIAFKIPNILY